MSDWRFDGPEGDEGDYTHGRRGAAPVLHKAKEPCTCPFHVEEDTTLVKRVALGVVFVFVVGFLLMAGR